MAAFCTLHASLRVVSAWRKAPFAGLSLHQKFPFPARAETGSMIRRWVPSSSPTVSTSGNHPSSQHVSTRFEDRKLGLQS
jgi:hypothetical protein